MSLCRMPFRTQSRRTAPGPSSDAIYTRLPNDSIASLISNTQIDHSQREVTGDGKDGPEEVDTILQGTPDEEDELQDGEEGRRQDGVKQAEAVTSTWTMRALIFTYVSYAKTILFQTYGKALS